MAEGMGPSGESVPVVLARMEGKLDNIRDKVGDLAGRVSKVEEQVHILDTLTQTLVLNAKAEEAKKVALALALKNADDTRREQSDRRWSPVQRFFGVVVVVCAVLTLGLYYYSIIH